MALANKPKRLDLVLSTSRLDKIIDIDVANLTVTAQAGVRLRDLQDLLGGTENRCFFPVESNLAGQAEYMCSSRDYKGVFLPLDPPFSERATLGGVIASNSTGPKRLRYGTPRDLTLGVRYVAPTGEVIGMGGKTVKNVSGYDVSKIMIGSLGTLGILGDVTCRLLPLPEATAAVLASFGSLDQTKAFADRVLSSKLLPTSLEILNGSGYDLTASKDVKMPAGGWCVAIGIEGFVEEVQREITDLKEMAHNDGASDIAELDQNKAATFWKNLADCVLAATDQGKTVAKFKGSFLISRYAEVLAAWSGASSDSRFALNASPGLGLVHAHFVGAADPDLENLTKLGTDLRTTAELHGGSMVVESAPTALKQTLNPWGSPREDFVLMANIKNSVDPFGILNPGRFLGGI
jgi:glycolate oxidase FAD binding subunit